MGFYALFGLLWRRVTIPFVLFLGCLLIEAGSVTNLFILAIPFGVGSLLGRSSHELTRTLFSRTLPNLRKRLFISMVSVGILTALTFMWVYISVGGAAPWFPFSTSVFFGYSLGLAFGRVPRPETMNRDVRNHVAVVFPIILLLTAIYSSDRIVDLYTVQPHLCGLLAFLGSSLCMHRVFHTIIAGEKTPGSNAYGKGVMDTGRPKWDHTGPIVGLYNWIRAGEYENFGFRRVGWPTRATFVPSIAVLGGSACIIVLTDDMLGNVMQQNSVAFQRVVNMIVTVGPAICALVYFLDECLYLQKGWVYPLSRRQLSSLAYRGALLYSAVFFGITLLAFLLRDLLMEQYAGYDSVRPLALMSLLTPFYLWLRLRYGLLFSQTPKGYVSVFGLMAGIAVLSWYSLKAAPVIPDLYEIAAFAGLLFLSQFLFRYKIERYYKTADLV